MKPKILIVDDDQTTLETMLEVLDQEGYEIKTASTGKKALNLISREQFNVVLTDLVMPDVDGMEVLKAAKSVDQSTQVIMITAYGSIEGAVEAMKIGALDYLLKGDMNLKALREKVKKALEKQKLEVENLLLHKQVDEKYDFEKISGNSEKILKVIHRVRQVAPTKATVLIYGESGTGKEVIAKAIHDHSPRKDKSFRAVNCGALYRQLLESELFGHEKGAFTGAVNRKIGLFEQADESTLFLDEVGEMSPEMQVNFLRVLEEKEFRRVGGEKPIKVDVRIIAATNKDLKKAIDKKEFRPDLYYRLNQFPIDIPLLRERREDIPIMVGEFLKEFAKKYDKKIDSISPEAMHLIKKYDWPGNVRELKNYLEAAVIVCSTETVELADLPAELREAETQDLSSEDKEAYETIKLEKLKAQEAEDIIKLSVGMSMEKIEKEVIKRTLAKNDGNKSRTAEILNIGLRTLYRKLDAYGLRD